MIVLACSESVHDRIEIDAVVVFGVRELLVRTLPFVEPVCFVETVACRTVLLLQHLHRAAKLLTVARHVPVFAFIDIVSGWILCF